jgi:hypothetical protein
MAPEVIGQNGGLSWVEFEDYVIKNTVKTREKIKADYPQTYSNWMYRGQSDSGWLLETSLERHLKREAKWKDGSPYDLTRYYYYISGIVPVINSLTSHRFE